MKLRAFNFFFKEVGSSIKRNTSMVIASTSTVAVSLLIFGMSLLIVTNASYITGSVESDVTISVYLKDNVNQSTIDKLKDEIENTNGVAHVTYVNKDQALQEFKKQLSDKKELVDALGGSNPLPNQYRVKTTKAINVEPVAKELGRFEGVDKVNYGQGMVEKIFALTKWVRIIGYTLMALLGLAAVFLISTTIRLTLFARRKEIQIMKFVGATDWFIRWPYILEGMFIGIVGAVISIIILAFAYTSFVSYIQTSLPFMPIKSGQGFLMSILGFLVVAGIFIGSAGSLISIRKYLRV